MTEPDRAKRRGLALTHAKAVHHRGPVCGADDGPATRVTEDRHRVTCPDCPEQAWIEALPDDATARNPQVTEVLREVQRGHMRKIDGVIVDPTTATTTLTVYNALKPPGRARLVGLRIDRMAAVAWRILRPHQ